MSVSREPGRDRGEVLPGDGQTDGAKPSLVASLVIATELWIGVVIAQIVATIAVFGEQRSTVEDVVAEQFDRDSSEFSTLTSTGFIVAMVAVGLVIQIAVAVALIAFTRRGYGWARFLLSAVSMYIVITAIFGLFGDVSPRWAMVPNVIGGVAAAGAVVLLLRRDSDTYCKEMAAYRARRKAPQAPPYPPGYPGYPPAPNQGEQYRPPGYPVNSYPPNQADSGPNPPNPYPPSQYPPNQYPPNQYPPNSYPPNPYPPNQYPPNQYPPSQYPYPTGPDPTGQHPASPAPGNVSGPPPGAPNSDASGSPSLQKPGTHGDAPGQPDAPAATKGKPSDQT